MNTTPTVHPRRFGPRLISHARALLAVSVLAALAVTSRSFAQAPTFNTFIATHKGGGDYWNRVGVAAVGDFNGDGKLDAFVTDGSANLRLMLGNGNGTFAVNYVFTTGTSAPVLVRAADLNGDGRLDAVCASGQGDLKPLVLLNTGNVSGVPQFTVTPYTAFGSGIRSLTVGDLNGDSRPDFIVGNAYGSLQVYLNNGNGTFTLGQSTNITGGGGPSVGAGVIVDLNGDGKTDYVVASSQSPTTNVFFGNGNGTLQAPVEITSNSFKVIAADVNNDGKPDLLEVNGAELRVYLNAGGGSFSSPTLYSTGGNYPSSVTTADFNGDGKLDAVVANQNSNNVAVLLGNGSGVFGAPTVFAVNQVPVDLTVGDFNGDGKSDIATLGYNENTFAVLLNTTVFAPVLPTQTLTILGGSGTPGTIAPNVEYYNPTTGNWQPAYLTGSHVWGFITGTNSWINHKTNTSSDPGAGPSTNQTLWYLYRVRFTVPADAVNPQMTFSANADNFTQVAINGVTTGGSTQFINNANMPNVIVGGPGAVVQFHADSTSTLSVHPGENTITLNVGDWGGLNGFNFRIDLSMQASQPIEVVPTLPPAPVVASASLTGTFGTPFSYTISATNSPTSYGATNLPPGLTRSGAVISGTPAQAGNFTVGLSATNAGGTGTGTLTLNIGKKSATIALTDLNYVYDGAAKSATATTNPAGLNVVFNYLGDRTNAGTATVNALIDDANYTGSINGDLVIAKASSTTTTLGAGPFTYDGTTHAGGSGTVSGAGVVTGAASVTYAGNQVNAGSYTVTAHYAGDANHTASAGSPVTITINKADATIKVSGYTGTYDAAAHGATGTATGVGGVALPGLNLGASFTNVPGGTANWSFAGGTNYNNASGSVPITINKANATVVVTPYNVEYDALSHSATVASITGVSGETGGTVGVVTLNTTHTGVGIYSSDSWSFAGANYNSLGATITDVIKDTTAPVIASVSTNAPTLWPPNHKMVAVTVSASASDLVGVTSLKIVSVTSSEPDNGLGDGDTANDIEITGNLTVNLRAERSGGGNGRTYTITVEAKDAAGNASTKTVAVVVPKNQNGK